MATNETKKKAEAEAEAETEKKAAAEAESEAEAEKKAEVNPDDELVTVQLFRDNDKYQGDVFVAVNGQTCLIKRGVPVQIKRKFARVLEESMAQDYATADLISRETSKFEAETKARGLN